MYLSYIWKRKCVVLPFIFRLIFSPFPRYNQSHKNYDFRPRDFTWRQHFLPVRGCKQCSNTHNMQILRRPVSLIIYEEASLYYLRCTEFPSNQRQHELNYHLPRQ